MSIKSMVQRWLEIPVTDFDFDRVIKEANTSVIEAEENKGALREIDNRISRAVREATHLQTKDSQFQNQIAPYVGGAFTLRRVIVAILYDMGKVPRFRTERPPFTNLPTLTLVSLDEAAQMDRKEEKGGGGKSDGKPGVFDTGGEYAAFNHPGCRNNLRNVKPKRIKIPGGWRNVYGPKDWSELHISRGTADCEAVPTRIACIYVEDREVEIGEGLDPAEEVETMIVERWVVAGDEDGTVCVTEGYAISIAESIRRRGSKAGILHIVEEVKIK